MTELFERISRLSPQRLALLVMDLQSKLDAIQRARQDPIAIVGMSCRTPGGVDSPETFWQLLLHGVDAITEVPAERWTLDIPDMLGRKAAGDLRGHWGGFIDGIDRFDSQFFGIVPREAARMDPQQRLLLEVSWEALERAGYAPDRLTGTPTGVFVGMSSSDYSQPLLSAGLNAYDLHSLMGGAPCIAAGRLSYLLGLQGPSLAVDTACSSSLVALHLAVQSLRAGECAVALAGGVNANLMPSSTIAAARAEALAPDGRCKAFDAAANGYVRSDGCGVVVLKRLADAQADGDTILALIRGTAVNQDGRSNGLTAPNGPSQTDVIRAALANGGVDPRDVGYIEAHGTGTALGDPIEAQALGVALGEGRSATQPVWIGSVKSNIGHLEAAAGVAGLIKLVLSLQHGQVPPSLHFKEPSPHIPWDTLPFQVPTTVVPWASGEGPRIGGVSSFGLSGTNAHIVVEAAPASEPKLNERERPLHILPLSAKTESALDSLAERFRTHLTNEPSPAADVAYTAGVGRARFSHRLAVIGDSAESLGAGLDTYLRGSSSTAVLRSRPGGSQAPKVAFLFTGLGSQHVGMGRQLYETQPTFRAALEQCQEVLRPLLEQPLLSVLYPEAGVTSRLEDRAYGLPVVFAFEYALAQLWRSWGIEPTCVLGHSLGEYVAACVAGVLGLEDGLRLSAERARLVSTLPRAGEMVSVLATEAQVSSIIADFPDDVSIAAVNGPESVVVAGQSAGFQEILARFRAADLSIRTLAIPFAAHSPTLEPILDPFEQFAATIRYSSPRIDLISGRTGKLAGDQEMTNATYWRRHLREPVRFADAVEALYAQGCRVFVEIGPAPVLLGLGQQSVVDPETTWLPSLDPKRPDWDRLLESVGTLFTQGVDVDWAGFDHDYTRRRVILPTYPFERERHWIEAAADEPSAPARMQDPSLHPLLGQRLRSPLADDVQFESVIRPEWPAWVGEYSTAGQAMLPGTAYVELALAAAAHSLGARTTSVESLTIERPLVIADDSTRIARTVLSHDGDGAATFRVFSRDQRGEAWLLHATGRLTASATDTGITPGLEDAQARCAERLPIETVYSELAGASLVLGPAFRSLVELRRGDDAALGLLELPASLLGEAAAYRIHPALLEVCCLPLQVTRQPGAEPYALLPLSIERARLLKAPGARLWSHVQRRPGCEDTDTVVCDVDLFDEDGGWVGELAGLRCQLASQEVLRRTTGQIGVDWFYELQWRRQALSPDADARVGADGEDWLIFEDEAGLGRELADVLHARGATCHLIAPGPWVAPSNGRAMVDPARPEDLHRLLDETSPDQRRPLRIVHLWAQREAAAADRADEVLTTQKLGLGSALHLIQALIDSPRSADARLWLVTAGAQPAGPVGPLAVTQAPLWGLGRAFGMEHPELIGGLIDLDPSDDVQQATRRLLAELTHAAGEDQVALRGSERYVARLIRRQQASLEPIRCEPDANYLVIGGLGGIGLLSAEWLAERGARHLVLMGRRGPSEAAQAALSRLEQAGVEVVVARGDVSRADDVRRVLEEIHQSGSPLRGIIHSGGMLDDGALSQQTWAKFETVLAAKVSGAWLLHELTADLSLDFFVLYSSVAALAGTPGQSNHAAANAFLDSLAHHRRAVGRPAISINWGAWAEVGAAADPDAARRLTAQGVGLIQPADGIALLERTIGDRAPQVGIVSVDWPRYLQRVPERTAATFFSELATGPEYASRVQSEQHVPLAQQLADAAPEARAEIVVDLLRTIVARALGLPSSRVVEPDLSLLDLGVDSLVAVEMRNRLTAELGVNLAVRSFIAGPTLVELADLVLERLSESASDDQIKPVDTAPGEREPDWTAQVAQMSEEDLDLLLAEMLASNEGNS